MNYQKHYDLLCDRAKHRQLDCYTEKHRILPGCLGGEYTPDNVVHLTAEEHYVAHQLLVKMYPEHWGLIWATIKMTGHPNNQRINNKLYGWIRRKNSKAASHQKKEYYKDPKNRAQVSQQMKELWQNFEFSKRMSQKRKEQWHDNPEAREQQSKRMSLVATQYWSNPKHREQKSQQVKEYYENPKHREQVSRQVKGKKWFHNPDTGQTIRRKPDAKIPDGFMPGRRS